MITYNPRDWISLIFHPYSRYVIRTLMPFLVFMLLLTVGLFFLSDYLEWDYRSTTAIHSLLGIVLGLFLVFRTNSAYDRWWEGRKHWGALVNNTRALALKLHAFLDENDSENREYFSKMIPNLVYGIKEHLRDNFIYEEMEDPDGKLVSSLKKVNHKPNYITAQIYQRIQKLREREKITAEHLFVLDKEVKSFTDIFGACERIKNTPIPYSYSMFIKKFIFTFTITLPLGLITEFGIWTAPIVLVIFYILVSIELIAEEIEDPFGRDINDLPTDDLAIKIRNNVKEILLEE